MRTNIILVDWESVQPDAFELLAGPHFRLKVFVGATQKRLPFDVARAIQRLGDRAEYVQISGTGPNALDFHIAFYLGQIAAADPTAFFHIISKDSGFDPLIRHLKTKKIFSARWPDVQAIPAVQSLVAKSPEQRAAFVLAKLLLQPTPPATEKKLRRAVSAHFQDQLSDDEVTAVIGALQVTGHVRVGNGQVQYIAAVVIAA